MVFDNPTSTKESGTERPQDLQSDRPASLSSFEINDLIAILRGPDDLSIEERNDAADALQRSSEQSSEADSFHKFWIDERSKRIAAVKALKSASTQCDNVIYNCNQRPADNQRHLDSWCSVKAFIDTAIRNDHVGTTTKGESNA